MNVAIATVLSAATGFLGPLIAGVATFVLTLGMIYLRGYLVPGTPRITERYFPERLLALFKSRTDDELPSEPDDADEFLREIGVLEGSVENDDRHLSEGFRENWRNRMEELRTEPVQPADVATVLDVPPGAITPQGPLQFRIGEQQLVQWESPAKMVADLAAGSVLEETGRNWETADPELRQEVLDRLRLTAERCPICDERVAIEDHRIGCCGQSSAMRRVRCADCSTTLAEGLVSESNT